VKKEICDQLITETEQSFEKLGMDFYQTMQKAPAILEKWKGYAPLFQKLWSHATNREQLTELLLAGPDSSPEEMETVLTIIRTLPYLLRNYLQDTAKALPPSPGGRPRELTPEQRKEVCLRIGQLYGTGVEVRDAQKRMAQRYGVSLRTIQRAWQERAKWNSHSNS
jgi:Trp operon repressor